MLEIGVLKVSLVGEKEINAPLELLVTARITHIQTPDGASRLRGVGAAVADGDLDRRVRGEARPSQTDGLGIAAAVIRWSRPDTRAAQLPDEQGDGEPSDRRVSRHGRHGHGWGSSSVATTPA